MSPDNDQPDRPIKETQPEHPEQVTSEQTASNPMGPRPVPPVYEPVAQPQPLVTMPHEEQLVEQQPVVASAQPTIVEPPTQQSAGQGGGIEDPQPSLNSVPEIQPLPPAPESLSLQNEDFQSVPPQTFSAPASGNQNSPLPNPRQPMRSKNVIKLAIAGIGGLLAVGLLVVLVMNLFGGSKIKLKKYSNDEFSISYPIDMGVKKDEAGVEISKSLDKDGSKITIVKPLSLNTPAKETMKLYKDQITQQEDGDDSITIVSSKETKINGMEAVVIIAKEKTDSVTKDSKLVLIASKDDKVMYLIGFENYPNDTDVVALSDDILKSFSIKTE